MKSNRPEELLSMCAGLDKPKQGHKIPHERDESGSFSGCWEVAALNLTGREDFLEQVHKAGGWRFPAPAMKPYLLKLH